MSKINLEGIVSKMSANQMKSVTGGSGPGFSCICCGGRTIPNVQSLDECRRRCGGI